LIKKRSIGVTRYTEFGLLGCLGIYYSGNIYKVMVWIKIKFWVTDKSKNVYENSKWQE